MGYIEKRLNEIKLKDFLFKRQYPVRLVWLSLCSAYAQLMLIFLTRARNHSKSKTLREKKYRLSLYKETNLKAKGH